LHRIIEAIVESRNRDHDGGFQNSQVFLDLHHISLEETILHFVAHGANQEASLEHVSKWEIRDVDIILSNLKFSIEFVHTTDIGNEIAVSQHDTLGHACSTRSVRECVVCLRMYLIVSLLANFSSFLHNFSVGDKSKADSLGRLEIGRFQLIKVDNMSNLWDFPLLFQVDDVLDLVS